MQWNIISMYVSFDIDEKYNYIGSLQLVFGFVYRGVRRIDKYYHLRFEVRLNNCLQALGEISHTCPFH